MTKGLVVTNIFDQRSLNTVTHMKTEMGYGKTFSGVKGHQCSFSTSGKGFPTVESMARLLAESKVTSSFSTKGIPAVVSYNIITARL